MAGGCAESQNKKEKSKSGCPEVKGKMAGGCAESQSKKEKSKSGCPEKKGKMAGGCGESQSKKEKSKSGCPEKKGKMAGGCAESQSKKEKSKSGCAERQGEKDSWGRYKCPPAADGKKEPECHESRKKFFESEDKSKKKSKNQCQEQKERTKCEDATVKAKPYKCKEQSSCCSPCVKDKSASCATRKERAQSSCGEMVVASKKVDFCKQFGQYVSPKTTPSLSDNSLRMPKPNLMVMRPCRPKVEKSTAFKTKRTPSCMTPALEATCPQLRKPMLAEFFCIDARNKQMNECIKQYMKDPSLVNVRCSQFAGRKGTPFQQPPAEAGFLPAKYRQIARRWLPAAGLYVAASAALAAWVTEWGVIVDRIPFYRDHQEAVNQKAPPASPPPETPAAPPEPAAPEEQPATGSAT